MLFNRNPIVLGTQQIEEPSVSELKSTFGLWNASWEDAIRYGGAITREALRVMNIRHDRKNIIVDTKIHMLMKGMCPAIPGWHCDGAPRNKDKHPAGKEAPDTYAQEGDERFNRYHLLVTGEGCLTQFIARPIDLPIPVEPDYEVYGLMSKWVSGAVAKDSSWAMTVPSKTSVEFDWWDIHTGILAEKNEWRYLIRVCESDYYEPQKDLRQVIRMQTQVYAPTNFSW